jgi:predicted transposase/invertase (TIGR01784 family)
MTLIKSHSESDKLKEHMKSKSMTFIEQFRAEGRQEGRQEGREEGRQEGSLEKAYAFARKLIRRNMPFEEICELTDLSLDEVKRLAAEISNQ